MAHTQWPQAALLVCGLVASQAPGDQTETRDTVSRMRFRDSLGGGRRTKWETPEERRTDGWARPSIVAWGNCEKAVEKSEMRSRTALRKLATGFEQEGVSRKSGGDKPGESTPT